MFFISIIIFIFKIIKNKPQITLYKMKSDKLLLMTFDYN